MNKDYTPGMDDLQDVLNALTFTAAMKLSGKSRSAIQNAIDTGKLAAKLDCGNHWIISLGSLVQLYGAPVTKETYDIAGVTYRLKRKKNTTDT